MSPFYNDHTAYGAILAFFIPIVTYYAFAKNHTKTNKLFALIVLGILIIAIVLSYSRAAWISVCAALGIYLIILLKINYKWILLGIGLVLGIFFSYQTEILATLERNKQDSSTDFVEHVQSISNISSDASNLERINRWQAALRMYNERPILGWGPGTYQFLYAPYQLSKSKTIISTNAGDKGNAHSEYIGPMAECGFLGLITFLTITISVIITALQNYKYGKTQEVRNISLAALLGFITYLAHGLLNNFLDSDKASVPFWGFIAIIVTLNIYYTDKPLSLKISNINGKSDPDQTDQK
jgi:O-antigen ligase